MGVPKGSFLIECGSELVDLGNLDEHDWLTIKNLVKDLVKTKTIVEPSKAYIAAFLVWLSDRQELFQPFDPARDKLN